MRKRHHHSSPRSQLLTTYNYLGIIINQNLSFQPHTANLVSKMFLLEKQILFLHPGEETLDFRNFFFLPLLDYGDLLFMNAPDRCQRKQDTVYHCALRFITGYGSLKHRCTLYAAAKLPSLNVPRLSHWLVFIYKSLLGLLFVYIHVLKPKSIWPALTL